MKNQNMNIPAHLQPIWDTLAEELRQASELLQEAQKRYHDAVLARIALVDTVNREHNGY